MTAWLSVVGIGEDGLAGLSPAARMLVESAEVLVGGERHLAMVPPDSRERHRWPTPFAAGIERIAAMRGRKVCVLATGDPMQFGVGATLARHVPPDEMVVLPHVSAFALAAARLAWPLGESQCLTLHGRPTDLLALHVAPNAKLLILAQDAATPALVAKRLTAQGFGDSRMVALAHLGGAQESAMEGRAAAWSANVPDFHTLAIECIAAPGANWHPRLAGLPDDAFVHDGKMTKREARAVALAKLMPHPGALLWDVGAGCGSIGIEWLRGADQTTAIALEPRAERRAMIAQNAATLGVPHLDIRDGRAPAALSDLPPPDSVFVGGGISAQTIAACGGSLVPGGRLVAHAVTLESEAALLTAYAEHGGELIRLSVAHAEPIGGMSGWRPAMPVTQWAWRKR